MQRNNGFLTFLFYPFLYSVSAGHSDMQEIHPVPGSYLQSLQCDEKWTVTAVSARSFLNHIPDISTGTTCSPAASRLSSSFYEHVRLARALVSDCFGFFILLPGVAFSLLVIILFSIDFFKGSNSIDNFNF